MRYLLILLLVLPLLSGGQDMRFYPTVNDLSTFQGEYAWYKLGFWQRREGTVTTATPGYNQTLLPGPTGYYFEKIGVLVPPATLDSKVGSKTLDTLLTGFQSITYTSGGSAAEKRTVVDRLREQLWVDDFRKPGDTDADVWEKAIAAMQALKMPLHAGSREYVFTRSVVVGGDFWHVIGHNVNGQGTVIKGNIPNYGPINETVPPDLSYPTATNPGPMRGCAFYFTTNIYYARTENLTFNSLRFGLAFLQAHNSPTFLNCTFRQGNVGVLCYQGSQNYRYINCITSGLSNLHISSATCFPAGSPYAGDDNYYTDGLTVKNEGGYGSFNCDQNDAFDTWFVASILRPATGSATVTNADERYPFADTTVYARPSGRVLFVPMRNARPIFGTQFRDIDVRGLMPRGFCLLNHTVVGLIITGQLAFEGMFKNITDSTAYFTMGSAHNGLVDAPFSNLGYIEPTHPLLGFSGRGYSEGFAEYGNRLVIVGNGAGMQWRAGTDNLYLANGRVSIGASNTAPSSQFDVHSDGRGSRPFPAMTATQRTAITMPAPGLFAYQTDGAAGTYEFNGVTWNRQLTTADIGAIKRTAVIDAAYSVLPTDYLVAFVSLSNSRTVRLPTAPVMANKTIIIKDESGKAATYNIVVVGTIDGQVNKVLNTNYGTVRLYSNGMDWFSY